MYRAKSLFILIFILLNCTVNSAQSSEFKEGRQYVTLQNEIHDSPDVIEFFSFYCPPCAAFASQEGVNQAVEKSLPERNKIVKYHVNAMGKLGRELTEAWSVAYVLGVQSKVELPLFKAVQETKTINSSEDIRRIFIEAGITSEQYESARNSIAVKTLIAKQNNAAKDFQVTSTPSFYIKGKYHVRNNGLVSDLNDDYVTLFAEAVTFLLDK
ncbi:DsbA family protein [Raoultella planticola]|uniref:DsbA family protein n=1 Tax=Raoultella planticola TaxID=575 RepID=UPI0005165370|nr:DsbA family protein [Raoultella planticola]MCE9859821.1 DsbA family protein [Raoultella planticola]HAT1638120.1 thioredoxin domain-containing protein [Raoultella planticola]HAT1675844.1 thioredoxin domain-containing protein [Raoultella planticola]HDG9776496.1 DsbA family protein [Raoultella planticola]